MTQSGVPVAHKFALGDLEEAFKPTQHFCFFCMGEYKQAK